MNKSFGWSVAISLFMILAGIVAIVVPPLAGIAATLIIGWILVIAGVAHLFYAWHRRGVAGVLWELLVGVLYLVVGIYILRHPVAGLASLALVLAYYLSAEAILEFILGVQLRRTKGAGWLWFDGIINLILVALILRSWPVGSAWVVGTLVGIGILSTAFARLALASQARRPREETQAAT